MHAAELPYVKQLEMEYVFPAYTGLAPRKIENGGDIAVLQGTRGARAHHADDDSRRRAAS